MSTDLSESDRLLTRDEVAEMLRLDPLTLARWARNRLNLTFIKQGQFVRYRLSDVLAFLESSTVANDGGKKKMARSPPKK
jgi:hypothetical protein